MKILQTLLTSSPVAGSAAIYAAMSGWNSAKGHMRRLRHLVADRKNAVLANRRRRSFHRHARVDLNAKCPACGHFSGTITFRPEARMIVHRCSLCGAEWGEPTVVQVDLWCAPDLLAQQPLATALTLEREAV